MDQFGGQGLHARWRQRCLCEKIHGQCDRREGTEKVVCMRVGQGDL